MNILYISGEAVPGSDGGAVHTWEVASQLTARGHNVTLVNRKRHDDEVYETIGRVTVIRASMRPFNRTSTLGGITRWHSIRSFPSDVICERHYATGGLGYLLSRKSGTPLVIEMNSPHVEESQWKYGWGDSHPFLRILRRWRDKQFNRSSAIITPLESIVPPEYRHKIKLVDWGADTHAFNPSMKTDERTRQLRDTLELPDKQVILFSGTFRKWHGVELLPEIASAALSVLPDAVFLCVGEGDLLEMIRQKVEKNGVERSFRFPGRQRYEDMPAVTACADVSLAPFDTRNHWPMETFGFYYSPLKIFESLATGIPVVTTDIPQLRRILNEESTGLLAREGEAKSFADCVVRLLNEDETRASMSSAARELAVSRYSWEAHAEQLERVFQSVFDPDDKNHW
jgi:glycosyltransferase involved in cell wall biosynthesis